MCRGGHQHGLEQVRSQHPPLARGVLAHPPECRSHGSISVVQYCNTSGSALSESTLNVVLAEGHAQSDRNLLYASLVTCNVHGDAQTSSAQCVVALDPWGGLWGSLLTTGSSRDTPEIPMSVSRPRQPKATMHDVLQLAFICFFCALLSVGLGFNREHRAKGTELCRIDAHAMQIASYNGSAIVAMAGSNCVAIGSDLRFGVQMQTMATDHQKLLQVHDRLFIGLSGLATDQVLLWPHLICLHMGVAKHMDTWQGVFRQASRLRLVVCLTRASLRAHASRCSHKTSNSARHHPRPAAQDTLFARFKFRHNMYKLREERVMEPKTFAHHVSTLLYGHRFGSFFCQPVIAGLSKDNEPYLCGMDSIGAMETAKDFMVGGTAPESLIGVCESFWRPDMVRGCQCVAARSAAVPRRVRHGLWRCCPRVHHAF